MQVFVPYPSVIATVIAMYNDKKRYNKEIIECTQILRAIKGETTAWASHPCTKMYSKYSTWLELYLSCFLTYKDKRIEDAQKLSLKADKIRPPFLTREFCDQHKRRLYTKNTEIYSQFSKYGKSEENWYVVNGQLLRYINGKKLT